MGKDYGSAKLAPFPMKAFCYARYDATDEKLAAELEISSKTLRKHRSGETLSEELAEKVFIKFSIIPFELINRGLSDLARARRDAIIRASSVEHLKQDEKILENLIFEKGIKDWGIYHLYALVRFCLWNYEVWSLSAIDQKQKVDMYHLRVAEKCWNEALKLVPASFLSLVSYIKHNCMTVNFLLKVYGYNNSLTGQFVYRKPSLAEKKACASQEYYEAFKKCAEHNASLAAWRDAVEMAIFIGNEYLIKDALSGYVGCVRDKGLLTKKAKLLAFELLEAADIDSTLVSYRSYLEFKQQVHR